MKNIVIFLFLIFCLNSYCQEKIKNELKPYVSFLKENKFPTAKDYILKKFKTKDIVIISERDHRDLTQYDIIFDVLKDTTFKGNIYTEVGTWNNYKRINKYLLNSNLTNKEQEEELLSIYRDLDYFVIWERYNYYLLLKTIYNININRSKEDKILLFPLDIEFKWENYDCHSQYKLFDDYIENGIIDRNIIMGENFVKFFEYAKKRNPNRKKALVIQNTYHGYIRIPSFIPNPTKPNLYSASEFIYKTYPNITTNIYINFYKSDFKGNLTNDGLFDAAFEYTKVDNVGFDLKNTPFGNSKFDLFNFGGNDYKDVKFNFIFDGMIFYKPIYEIELADGIPNVYPKKYEKQFFERLALIDGITYEKSVIEYTDYLKEINKTRYYKIPDSTQQKIKHQINQWIQ